jgi:hypothetical protein
VDFPANVNELTIEHIVLYVVRSDGKPFVPALTLDLHFTPQGGTQSGEDATSADGIYSTRQANAEKWKSIMGKTPNGVWKLALPQTDEVKNLFKNGMIEDILFVVTYSGTTMGWPA